MIPAGMWLAPLALACVIGLIFLFRRIAIALPGLPRLAAGAGPLRLEQSLAIDPRRRLLLVRCGERRVLLLTGGSQDLVVGWLDAVPLSENPEIPP